MTVKTQFVFEHTVALHLEELSTIENKSMNALIRDMIEERYKKLKKQKRLENFYGGIGLSTGLIGDTSIQKIKANKSV